MLFFGAGKRAHVAQGNKQERSQDAVLSSVIMPAAEKKGEKKGFDQRERVAFSGHSFLKRVTAGVGARSSHPVPRIAIRGPHPQGSQGAKPLITK